MSILKLDDDIIASDGADVGTFNSPSRRNMPLTKVISTEPLSRSMRHNRSADIVEPKVYSPHKVKRGQPFLFIIL